MPPFTGEGNEEIGNMIQNYIKEIEELRYVMTHILFLLLLTQIIVQVNRKPKLY